MAQNQPLKIFAYCRVSTKRQKEEGTIENQRRSILKFVEYNEDKFVIIKWFEDNGISAFKNRPAYNEMIKSMQDADGIIISKLDRIGRSVKQLSNVIGDLEAANKCFIVTGQRIDTSTKEGRLLFHMLSAIAEFEADLIRERMEEGRARAMDEGVEFGRPPIEISERIKKRIIKWYNAGFGLRIIQKLLRIDDKAILKLSLDTLSKRLKEWGVQVRDSNYRQKVKKIDYEKLAKEEE